MFLSVNCELGHRLVSLVAQTRVYMQTHDSTADRDEWRQPWSGEGEKKVQNMAWV